MNNNPIKEYLKKEKEFKLLNQTIVEKKEKIEKEDFLTAMRSHYIIDRIYLFLFLIIFSLNSVFLYLKNEVSNYIYENYIDKNELLLGIDSFKIEEGTSEEKIELLKEMASDPNIPYFFQDISLNLQFQSNVLSFFVFLFVFIVIYFYKEKFSDDKINFFLDNRATTTIIYSYFVVYLVPIFIILIALCVISATSMGADPEQVKETSNALMYSFSQNEINLLSSFHINIISKGVAALFILISSLYFVFYFFEKKEKPSKNFNKKKELEKVEEINNKLKKIIIAKESYIEKIKKNDSLFKELYLFYDDEKNIVEKKERKLFQKIVQDKINKIPVSEKTKILLNIEQDILIENN